MTDQATTRRRLFPLFVALGVGAALGFGLATASLNADLSEATDRDRAGANGAFSPPTGLDRRAPLPPLDRVGGAGLVEPRERPITLAAEVAGVVGDVRAVEGQRVAAGDVLVALRDGVARAQLDAAAAEERAARTELLRATGGSRGDELEAAVAEADAAAARAALSAETERRTAALFERGAASSDELDRARAASTSDAEAARAAMARRAASAAGRSEEVALAEARLAAASARRQQAEAVLAQHAVIAPVDGEVLQVLVEAGEAASPAAGLVVLGDTSALRARLDVDERDAVRVAVGQPAWVRIEGLDGEVTGKVVEVGRRVGRKNVRTDDPTDRQDARFVEVVVALDAAPPVPVGIRVDGFVDVSGAAP